MKKDDKCFDDFDFDRIAKYDDSDIERILNTEDMIRSPRKIAAEINNARCFQKVREEFGTFCDYIWAYTDGKRDVFHNFNFWTRCPKDKKTLTSYNGFYAREERTYTNLVPQIEKMI